MLRRHLNILNITCGLTALGLVGALAYTVGSAIHAQAVEQGYVEGHIAGRLYSDRIGSQTSYTRGYQDAKAELEGLYYVHASGGGEIFRFMNEYGKARVDHDKVAVTGPCGSACTFLFGYWDREDICVTGPALFGFHGVYYGNPITGSTFHPVMTEWTYGNLYPDWLLGFLGKHGWSTDKDLDNVSDLPEGMIWFTGAELGIKDCE